MRRAAMKKRRKPQEQGIRRGRPMGNLTLRPYQIEAVAKVRQEGFRQYKRVCFCLPTGGGKTVIFSHIIEKAAEKGSRTVVLAHRKEIASQISKTLTRIGVEHGRILAGQPIPADPIRVASVQTLARQIEKGFKLEVDFIIVDECHHVVADTWLKVIEAAGPDCYVLGVTATPERGDGRGLGDVFQILIEALARATSSISSFWRPLLSMPRIPHRIFPASRPCAVTSTRVRHRQC
jgi:DNA repair protein RadD